MMELLKKLLYRVRLLKPPVLVKAIEVSTVKNASFKFSVGGLAGQVRAPARRSEYLTRVEEVS